MPTEVITDALKVITNYAQSQILMIPGMPMIASYVKSSYQNDPFRVGLEALLIFFTLRYLLSAPKGSEVQLTPKEIDELVDEWEPEPLVNNTERPFLEHDDITSESRILVNRADGKPLINLLSPNYLDLHNTERIKKIAIDTVRTYGVGTCGPAGFYGTLDVHLKLEKELARVLGTESAIVYAQGFAALSSVIPAFSKRGDIIVADECVNLAIQKGMEISRSRLYHFKHNDMDDLERVLQAIDEEDKKKKRALTRKFIIVEGLYAKTGHIAKLRNLIAIKERFKYRLLVDESTSLGAIGPRGLGIADYFDVPNKDIDIIVGNMSGVLGAAGGFCAGSEAVIDHQRLSSQAYCFSASLPALLARSALENLLEIEAKPEMAAKLATNIRLFRSLLTSSIEEKAKSFAIGGNQESPLMVLHLKEPLADKKFEKNLLKEIVNNAESKGLVLCIPTFIEKEERWLPQPFIKMVISSGLSTDQIEKSVSIITECLVECKVKNF